MDLVRKALRPTVPQVQKPVFKRVDSQIPVKKKLAKPIVKIEMLSPLAHTTKRHLTTAILELHNELKRLSGRIVISDYHNEGSEDKYSSLRQYVMGYSLKPSDIERDLLKTDETLAMSDDDDDDDSSI